MKKRICKIEKCDKIHHALGYCKKHYKQFKKYKTTFKRTKKDNNQIIYDDNKNYAEIILYNTDQRVKIDKYYINLVNFYRWRLTKSGYIRTKNNITLHHLIIGKQNLKIYLLIKTN